MSVCACGVHLRRDRPPQHPVWCSYLNDWLVKSFPLHGITESFLHGSPGQPHSTNSNLGWEGVGVGVKALMLIGVLHLQEVLYHQRLPLQS